MVYPYTPNTKSRHFIQHYKTWPLVEELRRHGFLGWRKAPKCWIHPPQRRSWQPDTHGEQTQQRSLFLWEPGFDPVWQPHNWWSYHRAIIQNYWTIRKNWSSRIMESASKQEKRAICTGFTSFLLIQLRGKDASGAHQPPAKRLCHFVLMAPNRKYTWFAHKNHTKRVVPACRLHYLESTSA
jgi:hypothetical protein